MRTVQWQYVWLAGTRTAARPFTMAGTIYAGPRTVSQLQPIILPQSLMLCSCLLDWHGLDTTYVVRIYCVTKNVIPLGLLFLINSVKCKPTLIQEAQLMLTNPRDAFSSQSRSPNSTIPYVRYSFLMCNSNFVFKRRRFYDIRLQKMLWTWNRGQKSLKVIENGTIRKIVYGFLLLFFSNIVPKTHRFFRYSTSKLPWPWKPGYKVYSLQLSYDRRS